MKVHVKSKERFKLPKKQGSSFKGEPKSLTIRAGTIAKLKEKAAFGSTNQKKNIVNEKKSKQKKDGKKDHSSFSETKAEQKKQSTKDSTTDVNNKKKQQRFQKKKESKKAEAFKKKPKSPSISSSIAKISTKQFLDKSFSALNQDGENEGLDKFKSTATNSNRLFKTAKKTRGFITKNEKFSKSVTSGKLKNLRFSTGKEGKTARKLANRTLKKSMKQRTASQIGATIKKTVVQGISKAVSVATASSPVGWIALGIGLLLLLVIGITLMVGNQSSSASDNGSVYVKHWDGKDAYHSSLLAQRYGITAKQIDEFIKNEGYTVDERATGKEFIRLQSLSGIDVRMLVAFAQMESSFGTAGVAKEFPKANIFGYGAFDNDPNQGASWDNTRAVKEFRSTQIDNFGNKTIAIMDDRARAYHNNTLKPGQFVYWTALDAGKPRAAIAEKLDKWIDDHGGTPDPPGGFGPTGGGGAGLAVLDKLLGQSVSGEFGGMSGQCYAVTAYYAHSITPEIILKNGIKASEIGNDYPWSSWKWTVVKNPNYKDIRPGDIINFHAGANMGTWVADGEYGHTGVVGKVLGNNQFLLYDQNPGPLKTWTVTYVSGGISSVIHPPK
ncbi:CHAP domain-containing protein [Candidatus Enterococcus ikei]|uniref:CHAP domain-containing protein n=1 Tax=Candidatus Enterococcus ikei TaxID=2815326 RepID=A0ABS3H1Y6_9ENTE|nr:CHAP domain-containing protein [Enterococcus sp. DIV0869a]MBO0441542.1 CHAP domain-containing protein [Enterococcus sp. DIV0869a]